MRTLVIRRYIAAADAATTLDVFHRAIRGLAASDYDPQQIDAWASTDRDVADWGASRAAADTWVAVVDGAVAAFSDIDDRGYIDMMFVDPRVARQGVASRLLDHLTSLAWHHGVPELTVNASLTARPLFERHGFEVVAEQQVERNGAVLTNFRMRAPVNRPTAESAETSDDARTSPAPWLPSDYAHPTRVDWPAGVHLRPITGDDVDIDMVAVKANHDMLWQMFGEAWGWPSTSMTRAEDEADLRRHAEESERHESFNYAILPADESELYGCLYLDPLAVRDGIGAEVSWWVVAGAPEPVRSTVDTQALAWIAAAWPFTEVRVPFNRWH